MATRDSNLRLVTVKQLGKSVPLTEASLRWLLFHRSANGLDRAVLKVGRRVLIDRDQFDSWLEERREEAIGK